MKPFSRRALVAEDAGFGGSVPLADDGDSLLEPCSQRCRKWLGGYEGSLERPRVRLKTGVLCGLEQGLQVTRQTEIGGDPQIAGDGLLPPVELDMAPSGERW